MADVFIEDATDLLGTLRRVLDGIMPDLHIGEGDRVFLKPNLTYPRHIPGVTTSPDFIRAAVAVFAEMGARVSVGDGDGGYGAWSADVAFAGHGLGAICREYDAKLINLSKARTRVVAFPISRRAFELALPVVLLDETDVFVSLPVPKVHSVTLYSGAVKNQWGCIPDNMRLKYHPSFDELIWSLNRILAPRIVLGDAKFMLDRSGPIWGEPVYMNRVVASNDPVAFDVTVLRLLMHLDPEEVSYLRLGRELGHLWDPHRVKDASAGPVHQFRVRHSLRSRLVAAAFPRQWAVDLLWFSAIGDLAHRVMYATRGNPIADERRRAETHIT